MKRFLWLVLLLGAVLAKSDAQWGRKTDLGVDRSGAVGFSIGDKGYVGTGSGSTLFWEYDPVANTWTQKASFGGSGRSFAVGFSIGDKGYIGTGYSGSGSHLGDFWEYDPATNDWTQKANFEGGGRRDAVGFSIEGKGYLGTGYTGSSYQKDFWQYDPETNDWTRKADLGMPTMTEGAPARSEAVGFSIGSYGYVGTGFTGSSYQKDFWEYIPFSNAWIALRDFGGGARYQAVGFSIENKGYIGTGSYSKDFWEYDRVSNSWTRKTDFVGAARVWAVGFSIGQKGFIGTGSTGVSHLRDFWTYPQSSPTTQASNISFTVVGTTLNLHWTSGDGEKRIVVMKAGSPVDARPQDSTDYAALATFGGGSEITPGNYVVFNGSGNTVSIDGLSGGTIYHIAIFEFNIVFYGATGYESYLTDPATGFAATSSMISYDGPGGVGSQDGASQLTLWLKANLGLTVNGSSVNAWADQSGSGNSAEQAASENQPAIENDMLNGLPVIRFDGTGDYMQTGSISSFNTDRFTWFMVLRSTNSQQVYVRNAYTSSGSQWGSFTENNLFKSHGRNAGGDFKGSENTYSSNFEILSAIWNRDDEVIQYLNGNPGNVATGVDAMPAEHQFTRIGANSSVTPTLFMNGDIAEIIAYGTDLKDAQRILVENYLAARHNITLSSNVKYSGHDSMYVLAVAGIGREASGSHAEAHSDGLILQNVDALTIDGEYFMAGHALETNSVVFTDIPAGIAARWERSWYLTKTGSDGLGSLSLGFDYVKGGIAGIPALDLSDYRLLRRSGTSDEFSVVTTLGTTITGDRVIFDVDETELSDGYYTIGSISADPLALLNNGPGGVGSTDVLSSLKLWLKASTGITKSAFVVSHWADQSGNGNDAVQSTFENRPQIVENALNGLPVVSFFGIDEYMETASIPSFNCDTFTWFLVCKSFLVQQEVYLRSNYTNNSSQWGSFAEALQLKSHARDANDAFKGSQNLWNDDYNIISATWNRDDEVIQYLNGAGGNVATGADAAPSEHQFTRIGANSSATPGLFMHGEIAEIVVYTTDLNDTKRILVENYLAARYGLVLSVPTTKYSGHDATYSKSVAGIGRESLSDMHTQAHSEGMILKDNNSLSADGEYFMTGHSVNVNSIVSTDVPGGVTERWERVWYLKKTNPDETGSLWIAYDYTEGGIGSAPALDASEYRLLWRNGISGMFSIVTTLGVSVESNQVTFEVSESELSDGYYTIGSTSTDPLPIQMSSFTATANRLNAELRWRTESELENYGFVVERRVVSREYGVSSKEEDGMTNQRQGETTSQWAKIGFVPGAGTSSSPKEYSFADKNVSPGRYAYRIKQIDQSGAFAYTTVIELEVGLAPLEFTLAQNYPNPFNPTTTIEFTLPQDALVVLKVYDLTGREVATLVDEEMKAGVYQQVVFDASRLATGLYFARLHAGGEQLVRKMMFVK